LDVLFSFSLTFFYLLCASCNSYAIIHLPILTNESLSEAHSLYLNQQNCCGK
jgi:hypothetical protein